MCLQTELSAALNEAKNLVFNLLTGSAQILVQFIRKEARIKWIITDLTVRSVNLLNLSSETQWLIIWKKMP